MAFRPVPVESYAWIGEQDPAADFLNAFRATDRTVNQDFAAHQRMEHNHLMHNAEKLREQYIEPLLKQKLADAQLRTQVAKTKLQFLPALDHEKIISGLAKAQYQQGKIPLMQQQADALKVKDQEAPAELKLKQNKFALSKHQAEKQRMYAYIKSFETGAIQAALAANPKYLNDATKRVLSYMVYGNPNAAGVGVEKTTAHPPIKLAPDTAGAVKNVLHSEIQRQTVPDKIRDQRYFVLTAHSLLKQVLPVANQIAQYAGVKGRTSAEVDKWLGSVFSKKNPKAYQRYRTFITTRAPALAHELVRQYGGSMTTPQLHEADTLANPISWSGNPTQVINHLQSLANLISEQANVLQESSGQVENSLQHIGHNTLDFKAAAVPVYKAGGKSASRPTPAFKVHFANRAEANKYYLGLSPSERSQYQQYLKSREKS